MRQARSAEASSTPDSTDGTPEGPAGKALSEKDLGARISMLFRIHHDREHPFSEVVGVLQRIERKDEPASALIHIVRRDGQIVSVDQKDVVTFKLLDSRHLRET